LERFNQADVKCALLSILNFRLDMIQKRINPIIIRAALKWALEVDTYIIKQRGHNLEAIDREVEEIVKDLWKVSGRRR